MVQRASRDVREWFASAFTRVEDVVILMIVEILYTVQVSFREHTLAPKPFLIVGLIAVMRRLNDRDP